MTIKSSSFNARQTALLKALRHCADEMTGQQLHLSLKDGTDAMGLATVYRNLRQLQQRGFVRCRHLPNGEALYAPIERDRHHLTCVDCGRTQALDHCPIHTVDMKVDAGGDFDLLFHTLEFFGFCSNCRPRQRIDS